MKNRIKNFVIFALFSAVLTSSALFYGCNGTSGLGSGDKSTVGNDDSGEPVTVGFVQNGETKAQITVDYGKRISQESVVAPVAEKENCVTEWNFDFSLPVLESAKVNTVTYTNGLTFSKSLKNDYYLVTGYNGESGDLLMPDFYKGKQVTAIKAEAFKNNETIVTVSFPSALVSVADGAFKSCHNLTKAVLPDTVTTIGASAFADCTSLASFEIPPLVKVISARAAQGHKYDFIALPEGVTVIEPYAFASHVSEIVLPVSLKRIEYVGIWADLRKIYYAGTSLDWEIVDVSSEPYTGTGGFTFSAKSITEEIATLYFYSESEPNRPGNYWHYVNGKPTAWDKAE